MVYIDGYCDPLTEKMLAEVGVELVKMEDRDS